MPLKTRKRKQVRGSRARRAVGKPRARRRQQVEQQLRNLVEFKERQAQERAVALAASDIALRVNLERLRILQEGTNDGLWDWNILTGEDYFSPRWKQLLGYEPGEMTNTVASFYALLHPQDQAKVAAALEAHFLRGQPYEVEMRLRHKDGQYRWLLGRGQAVRDAAGQPVRMVGTATDITERKRAERRIRALSELGRNLNLATTQRDAAKHVLNVAQELLGWDACFVELYAPPRQEVVPVILMDTVNGQLREFPFGPARQRLDCQGPIPPARARLELRDPSAVNTEPSFSSGEAASRPASLLLAPICAQDRIIGVFSIQSYAGNAYSEAALETVQTLADYCGGAFERILTQTALKDSEARFAAFMDFLPASAYIKDATGRHLFVNRHLVESIGLGAAQWLGRRVSELLPGPGARASEQNDQVLLANGKPQIYEEQLTERGITHTYLSSKFPILQADGSTLLGGVSFEITEQRQIEGEREALFQQVHSARQRLEQLSRRLLEVQESERRRIARELHDQIGQALTAIQIKLQTAAREAVSAPVRGVLAGCLGMLDELLQLTQNISLNLRPSMLDDLGLETALRWLSEQSAVPGGPRGEFHPAPLDARLQPEIETACFRVAQEAVTNILRHSQAREFIVSLRREGDWLVLTVHDDGVGFDPQARFASPERYRDLGLLGMEERVALVGGRLEIHSTANAGTTVNAWFPLQWSAAESEGSLP